MLEPRETSAGRIQHWRARENTDQILRGGLRKRTEAD